MSNATSRRLRSRGPDRITAPASARSPYLGKWRIAVPLSDARASPGYRPWASFVRSRNLERDRIRSAAQAFVAQRVVGSVTGRCRNSLSVGHFSSCKSAPGTTSVRIPYSQDRATIVRSAGFARRSGPDGCLAARRFRLPRVPVGPAAGRQRLGRGGHAQRCRDGTRGFPHEISNDGSAPAMALRRPARAARARQASGPTTGSATAPVALARDRPRATRMSGVSMTGGRALRATRQLEGRLADRSVVSGTTAIAPCPSGRRGRERSITRSGSTVEPPRPTCRRSALPDGPMRTGSACSGKLALDNAGWGVRRMTPCPRAKSLSPSRGRSAEAKREAIGAGTVVRRQRRM